MRKLQIKFPDQIRIFGWDFGSSARAMNQVGKEDSLITYEFVTSTQADLRIVRGSTFFERKQMSTKTSIKRVALVAVSALGFGLLSVIPAKAAVSFASVANAGPVRPGGAAVDVKVTGNAGSDDLVVDAADTPVLYVNTAKPTGSTITFTPVADGTVVIAGATETIGTIAVNTAGTYSGYIFYDANDDGALSAGETGASYNFSTSGAAVAISASASASVAAGIDNTVTVNLLDSTNSLTESLASEFVTVAATSSGTITLADGTGDGTWSNNGSDSVTGTFAYSAFKSGTFTFKAKDASAGKTVTIVITPSLALSLAGATAKTVTFTTINASSLASANATVATSPTVAVDSTDSTSSLNAYYVSPSQTIVTYAIAGLEAGKAFTWDLTLSGLTATIDGASYSSGTDTTSIAAADGTYTLTVTYGSVAAADYATLDLNTAGTGNVTGQVNAKTIYATPAYAVTVSSPTVTPSLAVTGSVITVTGSIADQYGNPLSGATVTVTGTSTPSGADRTGSVATSATGTFTVTLAAAAAATTSLSVATTAAKSGLSISSGSTKVVNFSATGVPTSITLAPTVGVAGTSIPMVNVPTDGAVTAATDETYTLADGTDSGLNAGSDEAVQFTVTSDPAGQVVLTGSEGVYFSTTVAQGWSLYTSTLTVAGSGTTVYAISTKASATNTITATSGSTTGTTTFRTAASPSSAARNVSVSGVSTMKNGETVTITGTITDAFGNIVDIASSEGTVTASVTGLGFLNGSSTSVTGLTSGAAGTFTVQVVSTAYGTGNIVLTLTGVNDATGGYASGTDAQFGALAGTIDASATSAGTNGMTAASDASLTIAVTAVDAVTLTSVNTAAVAAGTKADAATAQAAANATAIAANATAIAALTALVEKLIADKVTSDAATAAAIQDVLDMASDANDNASSAIDAANLASEAADAATSAAQDAGDAVAALAEQVTAAQDISTEAVEAANAATDAANAAAEAADNAGSVAQDAVDAANAATAAVTALGTQLAAFSASVKAQITTLTNLVVKIQKKVKA